MTLSCNALRIGRQLSGILLRCGGVGAVRHRLVVVEVLSQLVDLDLQVLQPAPGLPFQRPLRSVAGLPGTGRDRVCDARRMRLLR